jgi:hypothetical protein
MKEFVCVADRVFFNKRIYNYGDIVNMEEELAIGVNKNWFEEKEVFDKKQEVVVKKIQTYKKQGKDVKEVILEAESEKRKLVQDYEAKIESLEKKINPKAKNDI